MSGACKGWGAFFAEGGNRFLSVGGAHEMALGHQLALELVGETRVGRFVQQAAQRRDEPG